MKILHVTKKYPPALGGDAVVVANLQKHQQAAGTSTAIVTSNFEGLQKANHVYTFGLRDTPSGLDTITAKRLISLIMLYFKMFVILPKERPNVIHTHSVDMAFFVSFAAHFYRIPIVHTFHIVTFYDENQSWLRRKSELWLAKNARLHRITAPNNYDVKKLRQAGLTQTVLLPNGVDIDFWETNTGVGKKGEFNFLAVGRLERQKGYEYLIRAAWRLADVSRQPFRVTIAGVGSEKARLDRLARELKVHRIVSFVGQKTPEEIRALLSNADVAVFPSLYETTPLTLLEAWAMATPVITTPVGIVREATKNTETCRIVPQKNDQALMQAMRYFMENPTARELAGAKGNEEVKQYAWPLIAQSADTLYRSVA